MKTFYYITLALLSTLSAAYGRAQFPVANEEVRLEAATEHLNGKANQVAIYSKGLVCSSCGIGLRIHTKKLDGLDETQLDEGILLDAKNQLVLIAMQPGLTADIEKLRTAVDKAGYESTHYYKWDGESVKLFTYEDSTK